MKLSKIRLRNFRSHADTILADLGRINVVRGVNGVGKSSINDAIEFAVTGKNRLTDEAGRGADAMASIGAAEFSVQLVMDGDPGRLVSRSRSGGGGTITVQGDPNSKFFLGSKGAEAWIAENLGDPEVLSVVLRAGRFVGMNDKDQKEFLAAALAGKAVDIPVDVLKIITDVREQDAQISGPAEADKIYEWAYKVREGLNREVKALGDLQAPARPDKMPTAAAVAKNIEDLENQKGAKESERTRMVTEFNGAKNKGREDAVRQKKERLDKHAADCRRLKDASAVLADQKQYILSDGEISAIEKTLKGKTKIEAADKAISALQAEINFKRGQVKGLTEDKVCSACSRPFDKEEGAADQIDVLTSEIGDREKSLQKMQADRLKMGDPAAADERHRAHKAAVVALAQAEPIMLDLKNLPANCDTSDLDKILNVEQPPDLFAGQCDTGAIDFDIEALAQRITKGKLIRDQILDFEGKEKQHALSVAKKDNLTLQVANIQKVIDAFAPAGPIRAQLVGDRLEPFKASLLAALKRFGFQCELSLEPYSLKVSGTQVYRPLGVRQLSESEQFRFGVAFQVAIAEATGVNFAVFDRSDVLLADVRPLLSRLLMESSLVQAFVMVATADRSPINAPGVRVFDLVKDEQGITRLVGAEKEEAAA